MKRFFTLAAMCGALTCAAFAASPKAAAPAAKNDAKSAVVKCPKCGMPLAAKADKAHTAAVKINGKTMYCCADCGEHGGTKTAAKGGAPKCPQCKMQLVMKKDKTHTAAVKVNGKTYYCCTACGKHNAAAKDAKKTASTVKCPNCGMQMKSAPAGPMYSTPMKVNGKTYYCCPACQKK